MFSRRKNVPVFLMLAALIAAGAFFIFGQRDGNTPMPAAREEKAPDTSRAHAIVSKVIDGDTVVLQNGESVRLLGIDADEFGEICFTEAHERLRELVLGREVVLESSERDRDKYGRLLRYIFVGEENISVRLVEEGLVEVLLLPDNKKYREEIIFAEEAVIKEGIGCEYR